MKCDYCEREFDASRTEHACRGCSLLGGCRQVKCPYCGHEMPREPGWLRALRNWWKGKP